MIGWILPVLLGLIVLSFFIPVRVRVEYVKEWRVSVRLFGTIPVWSFPSYKKPKDKPVPTTEASEVPSKETAKKPSVIGEIKTLFHEEGASGVMNFFGKLIELLKTTLRSLVRFITIRKLSLCVRVGGEEADEAAMRYGQLSAATAASLTVLSQLVRVKRPTVRVVPDFTAEQIEARMRMTVWVWPFGVVGVGIAAACKFLVLWMKTVKTPQNGAQNIINKPNFK